MAGATVWDLPDEVLAHILSFLPVEDIAQAARVCSWWKQVTEHRQVWHGKSYLYLSGAVGGLPDPLLVAKALPVLKRVSINTGHGCNVYLNGQSAEFQVSNLQDEVVKSVISSLVTENLSIDFPLLGDTPSNCLRVQVHQLKQLEVRSCETLQPPDIQATEDKLRALAGALSHLPLPHLQSAQLDFGKSFPEDKLEVYISDILVALLMCPALDQLSIRARCSLRWDMLTKFSKLQTLKLEHCKIQFPHSLAGDVSAQLNKLQVLELQNCEVDDIRLLDWCPQLRNLSIIACGPLRSRELSRKSELHSLLLRNLDVGPEFLDVLCPSCPQLQSVVLDFCPKIGHTLPLVHCSHLNSLEVRSGPTDIIRVIGLPSKLKHLRLGTNVTSNQLAEIVQCLPHLEILAIATGDIMSLHFLRYCACLAELILRPAYLERVSDFHELGDLKNLQKLSLTYKEANFGPLAEVLRKIPQLRVLEVTFLFSPTVPDVSFLRHCSQLHSLILKSIGFKECHGLQELTNQKELRKFRMDNLCIGIKDLERILPSMPHLEELHIGLKVRECDFSFLCHCPQLTSLSISLVDVHVCHFSQLRSLKHLRRLALQRLSVLQLRSLMEQVRRMPQLQFLDAGSRGCNFLDSWSWRRHLFSPRPWS